MPTISVKRVVDTTGAGDAFLGGIIAGDVISNDVIVTSLTSLLISSCNISKS